MKIDLIFNKFVSIFTFFYERILHEKMSDDVKKFVKNLSYVGFGTIIAVIFSFTFNILAGRILGPSGYGEFTLVQSIAMFLMIPMLLGFGTAMVKYTSENGDLKRQRSIISVTYIFVSIFMVVSISIYYLFSSQIAKIFSVPIGFFYLSIIFATLFSFYTLTTDTLRGLHEMKKYAILKPMYSVILLLTFLVFIFFNFISFKSMVFSICLAYGATGGIILVFIRKYIRFEFDKTWTNKLSRYSILAIIGGLTFVFYTNIDKILINKYMTISDVGIYKAYSYSFLTFLSLCLSIFITVFFPVASKCKNKAIIFRRINKFIPFIIIFGLPVMIGSGIVVLMLFGAEYNFNLSMALLFGTAGICIFINSIYAWLMNAVGRKGIRLTSFAAIIIALANIFLNILLIPVMGIKGAIIATIISYFLSFIIILSKRKYFYFPEAIE